jgi:hypothetical protein
MQETARKSQAFPSAAGNRPHEAWDLPHFIPSVELTGSRANRLMQLETLISYLQRLRSNLAGEPGAARSTYEGPSPYIDAPVWPWLVAGIVLGALFVVLLLAAWSYR